MIKFLIALLFLIPVVVTAQEQNYNVTSYLNKGNKAPNTSYLGEAGLNSLIGADAEMNVNITKATFKANSTLNWHKHSTPQI